MEPIQWNCFLLFRQNIYAIAYVRTGDNWSSPSCVPNNSISNLISLPTLRIAIGSFCLEFWILYSLGQNWIPIHKVFLQTPRQLNNNFYSARGSDSTPTHLRPTPPQRLFAPNCLVPGHGKWPKAQGKGGGKFKKKGVLKWWAHKFHVDSPLMNWVCVPSFAFMSRAIFKNSLRGPL